MSLEGIVILSGLVTMVVGIILLIATGYILVTTAHQRSLEKRAAAHAKGTVAAVIRDEMET